MAMVNAVIEAAQSYVYQIAVGIIVLLVGFALGVLAKKLLYKLLKEIELNKIMSKVDVRADLEIIISSIVSYAIYLVTIIIFLKQINIIPIYLVYLLVGIILTLILLTFIVGLKDIIPNFVAWLLLQKRGNIKEGRKVEIKEIAGMVEKVGYLETEIRTERGDTLYIPNSLFLKSKFKIKNNSD